jgi:hypothetical protein
MANDIEFVDGLIVKAPNAKAPSFVKASISIKVKDLGMWLREKHKAGEEWVNIDVKESKTASGTPQSPRSSPRKRKLLRRRRTATSTTWPTTFRSDDWRTRSATLDRSYDCYQVRRLC